LVQYLTMSQLEFEELFMQEVWTLQQRDYADLVIRPDEVSALRYVNPTATQLGIVGKTIGMDLFTVIADATTPTDHVGTPFTVPVELNESYGILRRVLNQSDEDMAHYLIGEVILERQKAELF